MKLCLQVTTLIESLPLMMDVGVLILWLVLVFSIVGMQQWLGKMSHRCFDSVRCPSSDILATFMPIIGLPSMPLGRPTD